MNAFPLSPSQISAILGRLGYFRDLGQATRNGLTAGARQISAQRGEILYFKGDPAEYLYLVVSGQIKLYLAQASQTEKVVALVGHGESFGIAPLWLGLPHPANAVAKSDSHLLLLDRHTLVTQARQDPALAECLMTDLSRMFQVLSREGAIEVQGRMIRVLDSEKLRQLHQAHCD